MNTYTYEFAPENKEIKISEEWMAILEDLDRGEYNNDQTEHRRHTSYSCGDDGEWMSTDGDEDILIDGIESEKLLCIARERLTEKQLGAFVAIAYLGYSITDYAREQGMSKQTVHQQYWSAVNKLKKFAK